MERYILKDNAKRNMQKNHWNCVAVAFLMSLAARSLPVINLDNIHTDSSDISAFFNEFTDFFSSPVAISMIITFIIGLLSTYVVSLGLKIFVFSPMAVGGARYFLKLRKNQPTEIGEVFANFKDKTFLKIAKTCFIRDIYISLFTLLFFIPGIIKGLEYAAVSYILAVRPDIDHKEALRLSKTIMYGHKLDLFILDLSFLGWDLLSVFTCTLLNILYVAPYRQATHTEFFCYVREEAVARGVISPYDIPDYEPYAPPAPDTPFFSTSLGINTYPQSFAGQPNAPQAPASPVAPENDEQITKESPNQENTISDQDIPEEIVQEEHNQITEE